jgi:hypothetical protein
MLTAPQIARLFQLLNHELARRAVSGEMYLVGGAVMCLVFRAREATKDIDALLVPAAELRLAVQNGREHRRFAGQLAERCRQTISQ